MDEEQLLEIIIMYHNKYGCTSICDEMPKKLYHRLHSFEGS